jgi:hypothetical protein
VRRTSQLDCEIARASGWIGRMKHAQAERRRCARCALSLLALRLGTGSAGFHFFEMSCKGDELTMDYELIDPGIDGTSFLCTCGAPDCRRVIRA